MSCQASADAIAQIRANGAYAYGIHGTCASGTGGGYGITPDLRGIVENATVWQGLKYKLSLQEAEIRRLERQRNEFRTDRTTCSHCGAPVNPYRQTCEYCDCYY